MTGGLLPQACPVEAQRSRDLRIQGSHRLSYWVLGSSQFRSCGSETSLVTWPLHGAVVGYKAPWVQDCWSHQAGLGSHVCVADIMARTQLLARVQGLPVKEQDLSSLVSFGLHATFLEGSPPPNEGHPELKVLPWTGQHAPFCLPGPANQLTMQVAWGRETAWMATVPVVLGPGVRLLVGTN